MDKNKSLPQAQNPGYVSSLCDIVLNKKRSNDDFRKLLQCLDQTPKECSPFKGRILQHLEIHGLGNSNVDLKLLSKCFAKATILVKKTANKDDGPLGAWKNGLLGELMMLEENLNNLYSTVGISTNCVIEKEEQERVERNVTESRSAWEDLINEQLFKVNLAAHNICALISIETDFDLPIPVLILLKIASKVGLLRLPNHLKKPSSQIKAKCYSFYLYLIEINLMIFRTLVRVLGCNAIPFAQVITQSLSKTLDWTRTSNLVKAGDIKECHQIRRDVFKTLTLMMEQLSLNINFEPQQLKTLIEVEIVEYLEEIFVSTNTNNQQYPALSANQQVISALECLENIMIVYSNLLEPKIENKVKNFIIQTCIMIYRNFDSNRKLVSLDCRRQLLQVLITVANQPHATSTTELSYHIFELVERLETDAAMKSVARKSLIVGLSHRPIIVTHHDVYKCYGQPMMTASETEENGGIEKAALSQEEVSPVEPVAVQEQPQQRQQHQLDDSGSSAMIDVEVEDQQQDEEDEVVVVDEVDAVKLVERADKTNGDHAMPVDESGVDVSQLDQPPKASIGPVEAAAAGGGGGCGGEQDESEILSYMNDFVEKLA